MPIFEREEGRKGRPSMQTNPQLCRNTAVLVEQVLHFLSLAPVELDEALGDRAHPMSVRSGV
jgi:hypothetical protein